MESDYLNCKVPGDARKDEPGGKTSESRAFVVIPEQASPHLQLCDEIGRTRPESSVSLPRRRSPAPLPERPLLEILPKPAGAPDFSRERGSEARIGQNDSPNPSGFHAGAWPYA